MKALKYLLLLLALVFTLYKSLSLYPILYNDNLAYLDSLGNLAFETDYDYVNEDYIFQKDGIEFLDVNWPEWSFPKKGLVTVAKHHYLLWLIKIDTSYKLVDIKKDGIWPVGSKWDYPLRPQNNGFVLQPEHITSGISYHRKDRYVYYSSPAISTEIEDNRSLGINSAEFNFASDYNEGIAFGSFFSKNGWEISMIDTSFREVRSGIDKHGIMSEGRVPIREKDSSNYIFLDEKGEKIINGSFKEAGSFHSGRALVRDGGEYFFIDRKGNKVIDGFLAATRFSDGIAAVQKAEGWRIIDTSGRFVNNTIYQAVNQPSQGIIGVQEEARWNFIDKQGNKIGSESYLYVGEFREGLAKVWYLADGDKYPFLLLINRSGKPVYTVLDPQDYRQRLAQINKTGS